MKISREFKLILLFIFTLIIFYFGYQYVKGFNIFKKKYVYYAIFNNANELVPTNAVFANGLNIGTVIDIKPFSTNLSKIIVTIVLREDFKIPLNSDIVIKSNFFGNARMFINIGDTNYYYKSSDTINSIAEKGVIESVLESFSPLTNQISNLLIDIDSSFRYFNTVLNPKSKNSITNLLQDVESTAKNLKDITDVINKNIQPNGSISKTIRKVENFSNSLQKHDDTIAKILSNTRFLTQKLNEVDIANVVINLNQSLTQLTMLLKNINDGKGTLGELNTNKALYENLNNTILSLQTLMDDIREHPKRYVNFNLFGKKDKTPPLEKPLKQQP